MKDIVVIYHSPCLDGFGGAYAAYKKFGDTATYLPMRRSKLVTDGLAGKDVYFIDFTYPQELTDTVVAEAKSVTILDHHAGVKEVVESAKTHVFDNDRSGATIAWSYFHPTLPVPRLYTYLEDIDLFRRSLPDGKEVAMYLSTQPFDFAVWEKLVADFEDDAKFKEVVQIGKHYSAYHDAMVDQFIKDAYLVEFEGHKVLAVNAPNFFATSVGNKLVEQGYPFGLTWHVDPGRTHISLRGKGDIDLSELARRYGGNGHKGASGIHLPPDAPLPFKRI